MTYTQLLAQARRNTGVTAQPTRAWPAGARKVNLRLDVWGPNAVLNADGSVTNPFTGVARPFNAANLHLDTSIAVQYPGDATWFEKSGGSVFGNPTGTWGKPNAPERQPILSVSLSPEEPEPTQIMLSVVVVQGPFDMGLSTETLDDPNAITVRP